MLGTEIRDQTEREANELNRQILGIGDDILQSFPIEFYVNDVKSYSKVRNYNYISPKLRRIFDGILLAYDGTVLALYHKLALAYLIKDSLQSLQSNSLPDKILCLYQTWLDRVLRDFSKHSDDFYSDRNDLFLKDLAVCSFRLFPVGGSWLAEVSGIGRKFLGGGGVRQFINASIFALLKMRGFKPFYQIHMDMRYLDGFSPEGREQCYLGTSGLLKLNPRIKGMYAASWFYDPELENVSPHLLYLKKDPVQNGGKVFRVGTTESDIKFATAKSATRRRLYERGEYMPTSYLLVWPRKAMLKWASKRTETKRKNQV